MLPPEILRLLIAALGGAAIGVERQWSGHADGPHPHFGGIRTFTLLGLMAVWAAGCGRCPHRGWPSCSSLAPSSS